MGKRDNLSGGSFEKEITSSYKAKKSHWFGTVVLVTLGVAAVGTVLYFTVIKKSNYTLTVTAEGVTGTPAAGTYTYKKGSKVSYNFTAQAGYKNLAVTLDGALVAASGSINMDKNHTLSATALEKGNYKSIKFRVNYFFKGYNTGGGYLDVQFWAEEDQKTFIRRIISGSLDIPWTTSYDSSITCDNAIKGRETSTDQEITNNYIFIYQDYMATGCFHNLDYPAIICPSFEISILNYTWETGKADPGTPQIQNLDALKIDLVKDLFQLGTPSSPFWIWRKKVRLDFVPPADPQNAKRVFVVSPCGDKSPCGER